MASGGTVYLGGDFTPHVAARLRRSRPTSCRATTWPPWATAAPRWPTGIPGADKEVRALAGLGRRAAHLRRRHVQPHRRKAGRPAGRHRRHHRRARPDFHPPKLDAVVRALALSPDGSVLYVGGDFSQLTAADGTVEDRPAPRRPRRRHGRPSPLAAAQGRRRPLLRPHRHEGQDPSRRRLRHRPIGRRHHRPRRGDVPVLRRPVGPRQPRRRHRRTDTLAGQARPARFSPSPGAATATPSTPPPAVPVGALLPSGPTARSRGCGRSRPTATTCLWWRLPRPSTSLAITTTSSSQNPTVTSTAPTAPPGPTSPPSTAAERSSTGHRPPTPPPGPYAATADENHLYVVGEFTKINGVRRVGFASFSGAP